VEAACDTTRILPKSPSMRKRSEMKPAVIVHGGAGPTPTGDPAVYSAGCRAALLAGWEVLRSGGSALDAVEAAVSVLEDDPHFNAGRGAVLNADGEVELDASMMDGERLSAGAVGAVRRIRHPIHLARAVLEEDRHVLLVGEGARAFARQVGTPECSEADLITEARRRQWETLRSRASGGTVGAVALDQRGRIAAGTSTGGMVGKRQGRVGDSALIGCGTYADSRFGGASATGHGEAIIRAVLAKHAIDKLRADLDPAEATRSAMALLKDDGRGEGGIILLDRLGQVGAAHNTPYMAHGWLTPDTAEPVVRLVG